MSHRVEPRRLQGPTGHPDEAVALGAAVQAALKNRSESVGDIVVTDVAPFSMGIASAAVHGGRIVPGMYAPIIERGTTIPASRSEMFSTTERHQTRIEVEVFQGEHALCRDNTPLGTYSLKGLPRAGAGEVQVEVRFTYDLNGILEVEMSVEGTERVEHLVIEQTPGTLSRKQVADARRQMARLKFHPRELLPNQTVLNRADALFAELQGPERQMLQAVLSVFLAALESQDPSRIAAARAELAAMIEGFRRHR